MTHHAFTSPPRRLDQIRPSYEKYGLVGPAPYGRPHAAIAYTDLLVHMLTSSAQQQQAQQQAKQAAAAAAQQQQQQAQSAAVGFVGAVGAADGVKLQAG